MFLHLSFKILEGKSTSIEHAAPVSKATLSEEKAMNISAGARIPRGVCRGSQAFDQVRAPSARCQT